MELRSETVEVVEGNQEESENIHNGFRSPGKEILIFLYIRKFFQGQEMYWLTAFTLWSVDE